MLSVEVCTRRGAVWPARSDRVIFVHVDTCLFTLKWIICKMGIKNLKTLTHVVCQTFARSLQPKCTVHREVALYKLCSYVCGQRPYSGSRV